MDSVKGKREDLQKRYKGMSEMEKRSRQVFAVSLGAPVSFSATQAGSLEWQNYRLDHNKHNFHCWAPPQVGQNIWGVGQWAQVYQQMPKFWTGVVIQGRGDKNDWVQTIKVTYSLDGVNWNYVDEGKVFLANCDSQSKVRAMFKQPVLARTIRIYPQTWNIAIAMRFDAIFIDFE